MMKRLEELSKDELWQLRNQVVLNSLFVHDYENSFGISPRSACDFFEGYVEFLAELASETGTQWHDQDSPEHLHEWLLCSDDYSWVKYDPVEI